VATGAKCGGIFNYFSVNLLENLPVKRILKIVGDLIQLSPSVLKQVSSCGPCNRKRNQFFRASCPQSNEPAPKKTKCREKVALAENSIIMGGSVAEW